LQRVWRIVNDAGVSAVPVDQQFVPATGDALELRRTSHKTLKNVSAAVSTLRFNRAIAYIYEFVGSISSNRLEKNEQNQIIIGEACTFLAHMMAPFVPHFSEAVWQLLGQETLLSSAPWPVVDDDLTVDDQIILPIQINGKRRDEIEVAVGASSADVEAMALARDAVQRHLDGRPPKKVIVVPGRIINIVG
jgi:leucyl-tRNA synthetase